MPKVVDITLRGAIRGIALDNARTELRPHDQVVVRTERGLELAEVRSESRDVPEKEVQGEMPTVERRASAGDVQRARDNELREYDAMQIAIEKVAEHGLPMKMIAAECTLDGGRLVLHFERGRPGGFPRPRTRSRAGAARPRIELHQVGVRDEAKLRGGLGSCGRPLCCTTFLNDFEPVGIRMAKEQDLSLNPQKISGVCSRLMCCLNYEYAHYKESRRCVPKLGATVKTEQATGKLIEVSVLKEEAVVLTEEGARASRSPSPPSSYTSRGARTCVRRGPGRKRKKTRSRGATAPRRRVEESRSCNGLSVRRLGERAYINRSRKQPMRSRWRERQEFPS